ncbi:MAG: protein arginine kinase [Phycisphaerae bacterium]|nr:protein arginine kinase [Phycisphaerae bacterium]
MTLDDLINARGAWLRGEGPETDIVISSRIRLARNLADFSFLGTADSGERTEVYRVITDELSSLAGERDSLLVDVNQADEIDRQFLIERHLISRHQAAAEGSRGVSISDGETRAVMINEEDHLRIQGLRSGLQLDSIWEELNSLDDALGQRVPFAFDKQLGYLTACPTNVGTGIRVSVMVHLPALRWTKDIERVEQAAKDMRLAVRGLYGEGTEAVGDLFQISNQVTLGQTEEEIIKAFAESIIPRICQYERAAREAIVRHGPAQLDDRIWRAYGILKNARYISSNETQSLLSPLRMGIHLGRFTEFDIKTLNELFLNTQTAHLQKLHGRSLGDDERAIARANYIREHIV